MTFLRVLALGATIALGASLPVQAAPVTYRFSGALTGVGVLAPVTDALPFADGQSFSGTFVYDPDAVQEHLEFIRNPDWSLDIYYSPITSFSFQIDGTTGPYRYSPPVGRASSASVADGTSPTSREGVGFSLSNYPISRGGPAAPWIDVPDSAFIGDLYPHSTFLSLMSDGRPDLLDGTSPDVDLAELFERLDASSFEHQFRFSVRFTDPANPSWAIGNESVAFVLLGRVDTLEAVEVPEPAVAGVLGLGLAGLAWRRRQKATSVRAGR